MPITTKKWAKRPLERAHNNEYRFRNGLNQPVKCHFTTRIVTAPAKPRAVLYSRLLAYTWDTKAGWTTPNRGKKHGTLERYSRNSSGKSRARCASSLRITKGYI